ncbi:MAG TPA: hypothetical protein VLJ60_09620 [bacterium]|nr:hypothetical protein [bacterium]
MKKFRVSFIALMMMFLASCADTSLKPEEAEKLIKERLSKMPGRSVSFYLGAMTDPAYFPIYKKIATGKYLTLKEDVFVEAAGKKMPMFEATPEGEKIFKCENNRCSVEVCKTAFDRFVSIVNKGKFANATYQIKTVCDGEIYNIFKPLAERQYIKPETVEEKAEFEFSKDIWIIK